MQPLLDRYWLFGATCLFYAVLTIRLVVKRHVTLQGTLAYLILLFGLGIAALFPSVDAFLATRMGFALVSNWFFAVCIAALSFLHLLALATISRIELRSIELTQELALLEERVNRLAAAGEKP